MRYNQQPEFTIIKHQKLHGLILWLLAVTLITTGCAINPTYSSDNERFIAAKKAFMNHEYVQAAYLLEPLSIKGDDQAQYTLGYLYFYGLGVTQNLDLAKKWIISSASKGNEMALEALELVAQRPYAAESGDPQ